jgi:hypothetical protein
MVRRVIPSVYKNHEIVLQSIFFTYLENQGLGNWRGWAFRVFRRMTTRRTHKRKDEGDLVIPPAGAPSALPGE